MRRRVAAILRGGLTLVTACASSGPDEGRTGTAGDDPAALIEALPAAIATVTTAGWWSEADREGPYRIVITEHGYDELVSRLYLQWLEPVDEPPGSRVVGTVGFDELNEVPLYRLEVAATRDLPTGLEVELRGASPYTGEERRFLLRAGPPGVATLRGQP